MSVLFARQIIREKLFPLVVAKSKQFYGGGEGKMIFFYALSIVKGIRIVVKFVSRD